MRIPGLGLEVRRVKAAVGITNPYPVASSSVGWFPIARSENFQTSDRALGPDGLLAYFAVYACLKLLTGDFGKMRLRLMEEDADGIWNEVDNPAFSPVLRKPNHYQTQIKFLEWWLTSKLVHGNTYALKVRDSRQVVTDLYILDPSRVTVLVSPNGFVFYRLTPDNLSGVTETVTAPAREIIHDVLFPLVHPLCGVSPLIACSMGAIQGMKIQEQSTSFFANGSQPGGILSGPNKISNETADRLRKNWDENYGGPTNVGRLAVLGDGLTYTPMMMTAHDAQLIEQLRWTAEVVCAAFGVPLHKINVGTPPNYNNVEALDQQYYSQGLQTLMTAFHQVLDHGLGLGREFGNRLGARFDLDDLLQMDSSTQMATVVAGVKGGVLAPNEGRRKINYGKKKGGDTPYLQQQDFSLAALDARDRAAPAPSSQAPTPAPAAPPAKALEALDGVDVGRLLRKVMKAAA